MSIVLSFEKRDKQAIIFIGIQASGKTIFYDRMLSNGYYTHIDVIHTSNRFNGDHVKGIEEYEDELRKKYADDSVEKSVDDNTVPSVPDNRANGFWDKRQAKEGLEAGSDRLHVGESG